MKINLQPGILRSREKRFLAHVELASGENVIAHCANPGSMRGNAEPGMRVWLEDLGADHLEKGRKLRYKWILVESRGVRVCVDTSLGNKLVAEALQKKKISELAMYASIKPEASRGDSRFDFLLQEKNLPDCYVEVKSVSMGEGAAGSFPDSITKRGQKHLLGLQALKKEGMRAVLFFLLMREAGETVSPAGEIDPEYKRLLQSSVKKGVEVLVYVLGIRDEELFVQSKGVLLLT